MANNGDEFNVNQNNGNMEATEGEAIGADEQYVDDDGDAGEPIESVDIVPETPDTSAEAEAPNVFMDSAFGSQAVNLTTDVDIVFVIDATGSMGPFLNKVKDDALNFMDHLKAALAEKKRVVKNVSLKVISFRDYFYDEEPMNESRFFRMPDEISAFRDCVNAIMPTGGEDEPESALEALFFAMHSQWSKNPSATRRRQLILIFTDASAHKLDDTHRAENPTGKYPADQNIPTSLLDLEGQWKSGQVIDNNAKRMILFAPNDYPWNEISNWDSVYAVHSSAGTGLDEVDLDFVYKFIAGSI